MASADLDHIRALLIAQTAEPEPKRKPFVLFGKRRPAPQAPLAIVETVRRLEPLIPEARQDTDQELLLERICAPPSPAPAFRDFVEETVSPLPPPEPRAAFGRRADTDEFELMLDHPEHDDAHAVPYFPEDLSDGEADLERLFNEPQPLRPWIKALRNSSRPGPTPAPAAADTAFSLPTPAPPIPAAKPRRRRTKTAMEAPAARAAHAEALSRDLLEALELTLLREHHGLADHLAAFAA